MAQRPPNAAGQPAETPDKLPVTNAAPSARAEGGRWWQLPGHHEENVTESEVRGSE